MADEKHNSTSDPTELRSAGINNTFTPMLFADDLTPTKTAASMLRPSESITTQPGKVANKPVGSAVISTDVGSDGLTPRSSSASSSPSASPNPSPRVHPVGAAQSARPKNLAVYSAHVEAFLARTKKDKRRAKGPSTNSGKHKRSQPYAKELSFRFLSLPTEVRKRIYPLVLFPTGIDLAPHPHFSSTGSWRVKPRAILQLNSEIRTEALAIYYGEFDVSARATALVIPWLRSIDPAGRAAIPSLTVRYDWFARVTREDKQLEQAVKELTKAGVAMGEGVVKIVR